MSRKRSGLHTRWLFPTVVALTACLNALSEDNPWPKTVERVTQKLEGVEGAVSQLKDSPGAAQACVHLNAAKMGISCAIEAAKERVGGADAILELAQQQFAAAEGASRSAKPGVSVIVAERGPFVAVANSKIGLLFKVTDQVADLRGIYHAAREHQFLRWMIGTRPMNVRGRRLV